MSGGAKAERPSKVPEPNEFAMFNTDQQTVIRVSMTDSTNPLASFSQHSVSLDGGDWPSVEHYFQGMKFLAPELRALLLGAAHPATARQLAKQHRRRMRADWKQIEETVMTRGVYVKCRTHEEAATALLATGNDRILETSQYDYRWGCGRDGRGKNAYGRILMAVRDKLRGLPEEG